MSPYVSPQGIPESVKRAINEIYRPYLTSGPDTSHTIGNFNYTFPVCDITFDIKRFSTSNEKPLVGFIQTTNVTRIGSYNVGMNCDPSAMLQPGEVGFQQRFRVPKFVIVRQERKMDLGKDPAEIVDEIWGGLVAITFSQQGKFAHYGIHNAYIDSIPRDQSDADSVVHSGTLNFEIRATFKREAFIVI